MNRTKTPNNPSACSPPPVPSRYSPEERLRFQQEFAPLVRAYRRLLRRVNFTVGVGFLFVVSGIAFPHLMIASALAALVVFSCGACLYFSRQQLYCPGCAGPLEAELGEHCPECGSGPIQQGSYFRATECMACHNALSNNEGRNYRIRFCTYCGLNVDTKGL